MAWLGVGTAVARSGKVGVGVSTIITDSRVGVGATVTVRPGIGTGVTVGLISGDEVGDLTGANDGGGEDPAETIVVAGVVPSPQASTVNITTAATANSIFPCNGLHNYSRFLSSRP